jgi:hypothetical protein
VCRKSSEDQPFCQLAKGNPAPLSCFQGDLGGPSPGCMEE